MLDIEYLYGKWQKMRWRQKVNLAKRAIIQCSILCVISVVFFWTTLFTMWIFTYIISPSPYLQQITPIYHVPQISDSSIVTIFTNQLHKALTYFDEMIITKNQFCNIQHDDIPYMTNLVTIRVKNIDNAAFRYIKGCIKYVNKRLSCQRYHARLSLYMFKQLRLIDAEYIYLQMQFMNKSIIPAQGVIVQFEQDCWYIVKLFKDYYRLFTIVYTYGVTVSLTLCIMLLRIVYILKKIIENQKQSKKRQQQNKMKEQNKKNSDNSIQKQSVPQKSKTIHKDKDI